MSTEEAEGSVAERLATFVHGATLASMPSAVVERARHVLLDTVGNMLAGSVAPEMVAFRSSLGVSSSGQATVIGDRRTAPAHVAALLNGCLTTILEFDEGHRESMGHPGIHIVPAVLAIAEELDCSGEDCLVALIVGYEVAVRVGRSVFPLRQQLHPHGNWATIGAAVAAGKLLGLGVRNLSSLVDCAAMMSLFSWRQATVGGATIHHAFPGLAAQNAIVAANAVRSGLSGQSGSLEQFLLPFVSERPSPSLACADLGTRWELLENYFKPYPACAHAHSAIAATRRILESQPVNASDIVKVRVTTYPLAATLREFAPRNQLASMFSIPYNVGLLITSGQFNLAAMSKQAALSDDALHLAKRVEVVGDAVLTPKYPLGRPSKVEIFLRNGKVLDAFVAVPPPFAEGEELAVALRDKFMRLAAMSMAQTEASELLERLLQFEYLSSTRTLFAPTI